MNARKNQSGAMIHTTVATSESNVVGHQDITVMVIVVVLMILGLLLSSRSGGG